MADKFSKENIQQELFKVLNKTFEIPLEDLNSESNLYTDLDLDSIDAVDPFEKFGPQSFAETAGDNNLLHGTVELAIHGVSNHVE